FEEVGRMKAAEGVDTETARLQQSIVYQKIGGIQTELVELDAALAAYQKAMELTPNRVDVHIGLGDGYSQQGRPEDALREYSRGAAADPKSVAAHIRIADGNLRLGRNAEAVDAAQTVLRLDAANRRAHYVLSSGLVRLNRAGEGDKELELYRKVEADARSQFDRNRNIGSLNRGAAAKLLESRPEEAIDGFLKIIQSYPDAAAAY